MLFSFVYFAWSQAHNCVNNNTRWPSTTENFIEWKKKIMEKKKINKTTATQEILKYDLWRLFFYIRRYDKHLLTLSHSSHFIILYQFYDYFFRALVHFPLRILSAYRYTIYGGLICQMASESQLFCLRWIHCHRFDVYHLFG